MARAQRLDALAEAAGLRVPRNAAGLAITGACALLPGRSGCIARAEGPGAAEALGRTRAAAVVTTAALAPGARVLALTSDNPKLAFARMLALFEPAPPAPGVHASAVIADDAHVDAAAAIGPHVVIGAGCALGPGTAIGANSVLGAGVRVGPQCRIAANVSLGDGVDLGARVAVEANAAIGGRGFGLVHDGAAWQPIPQLGAVRIEDDVEIGAGTTIDRGALDDTIIGRGVKIDDQVHIGHNCVIGAHTVIAGCTGIAGSCTIGAGCMIGGGVGIGDHVTLADGVVLTAASQVPANIDCSGVYSSTFRAMPARIWRKRLALFRQLDRIDSRLRGVENARGNKR